MAHPDFNPVMSTLEIWREHNVNQCLEDDLVSIEENLENKADTDHTHSPASIGAAPLSHTHQQGDISGLAASLAGKADGDHTHPSYVTIDDVYPVGSIYMTVNNVTPASLFGGTWVRFGAGRVIMGADENGAAEATGGSDTAQIPAHKHTTQSHTLTVAEMPNHHHWMLNINNAGEAASYTSAAVQAGPNKGFGGNAGTDYEGGGAAHSHGDTGNAGAQTIDVRQAFITCFMWKRTA